MSDLQAPMWRDLAPGPFVRDLRMAVAAEVEPEADRIDREDYYPRTVVKALARRGYTSLVLPKDLGGMGADYRVCLAMFEEVAHASAAVAISLITILQAQTIIRLFGPPALKDAVLGRFREGLITAYALTEANHGSDIRHLDTKASRTKTGWTVTGRKSFITSGSAAEAFVLLAETDNGVSTFFVPADSRGLSTEVTANASTFGLRNGPHVDLILDDVALPDYHLIGTEGKGVRQAVTTLDYSRTMAAGISLGIARAAFEGALEFSRERIAFDRKVSEFQGIQWYFAEMLTSIDAARFLVYEAADALTEHREIDRLSSEAKLLASRVAVDVTRTAVQVCGAYGVMESAPFSRYLRDAKAYEIAGGSSEILKNTIAKALSRMEAASNKPS